MDRAALLLGALRVKARRDGSSRLAAGEVDALADAIGIERAHLPTLIEELAAANHVKLVWNGLEVAGAGEPPRERVAVDADSTPLPPEATPAGPAASGPAMSVGTEFVLDPFAAVLRELRAVRPRLHGLAAQSAAEAEAVLLDRPDADAPAAACQDWAARLMDALNELVRRAPESEAELDLAERAHKALGRR